MGGLVAAAALDRGGINVTVYEQAARFARVGAGIQMGPNAVKVLRGLGLEQQIRSFAFQPPSWRSRVWDTGEEKFNFPLGEIAEAKYGAPYLQLPPRRSARGPGLGGAATSDPTPTAA